METGRERSRSGGLRERTQLKGCRRAEEERTTDLDFFLPMGSRRTFIRLSPERVIRMCYYGGSEPLGTFTRRREGAADGGSIASRIS